MKKTHAPSPSHRTSRRQFLAGSAAVAAGASVLTVAQSAHAAGTDTVKIGIIGCGDRGTQVTSRNLLAGPYVKLVAMCDVFPERIEDSRRRLIERNGAEQVQVKDDHCFAQGPDLDGYKHVIEAADVVLIACASKFHPMYAEAALRAGKHVFVEKPHGIDPAGVKHMKKVFELAKTKNLSCLSGLMSRFHEGYQECMKRIHDGAIGKIVSVQCMFLRAPYVVRPRETRHSELEYQFWNWYHFCWLSGDDVPQSLIHNIDRAASWAMKEETPTWCFGLGGRSASIASQFGDMFDHHTIVYEYASGARVYALSCTQADRYHNYSDIIMGTKGTCYLADSRIEGENPYRYGKQAPDPLNVEQKALIDAVRAGKPINSGYHAVDSTMTTVMGQMACYTGQSVAWKDVWNSDMNFGPRPEQVNMKLDPPVKPDSAGIYPVPKPGITKL